MIACRVVFSVVMAVASMVMSLTSVYGAEDKITRQQSLVKSLERQVAEGEREVARLRKSRSASEVEVRKLASQVEARGRLLVAQEREVALLKGDISSADANILRLSKELSQEREHYGRMVREAYRSYSSHNILTYLFTSKDFEDVARKVANLRAVAQLREDRIERIDSLSLSLAAERGTLLDRQTSMDRVVSDLKSQKSRLESDVASARRSISAMSAKERKVLQQRELQQRQLDAAIKELQKLIKDNQSGASFSTKTKGLNLPVVGGRVKQYKENMAEVVGAAGAKVRSIYEGKVVDVRLNRITGKYDVYIAHGEYISSYAGLSEVAVEKDKVVSRSDTIGVIGEAVDIITMQSEYKIVFGIYPPSANVKMSAANCFKK